MNKPLAWIRLWTEIIDDEKVRLLAFEDRWHYIALLCCKGKGILDEQPTHLIRRKVAIKLGLDLATLDEAARRLAEVGLIDADTLQPLAWSRRQFKSDYDPTNAERQRKLRRKNKDNNDFPPSNGPVTDKKQTSNGPVTDLSRPPETETETETETDKEILLSEYVETTVSPPAKSGKIVQIDRTPYAAILDCYHGTLPELRTVRKLTPARQQAIRNVWRGDLIGNDLSKWQDFFAYVRDSCPFLVGRKPGADGRAFQCDLEWLMKPGNLVKVVEGKYEDGARHG